MVMKSRSGIGSSWRLAHLFVKRLYRKLTGASMLMRRKNGLLKSSSNVVSSWMSVKTQCSRHRFVTKSSKESTSGNVNPRVPFSSVTEGSSLLSPRELSPARCSCDGR